MGNARRHKTLALVHPKWRVHSDNLYSQAWQALRRHLDLDSLKAYGVDLDATELEKKVWSKAMLLKFDELIEVWPLFT